LVVFETESGDFVTRDFTEAVSDGLTPFEGMDAVASNGKNGDGADIKSLEKHPAAENESTKGADSKLRAFVVMNGNADSNVSEETIGGQHTVCVSHESGTATGTATAASVVAVVSEKMVCSSEWEKEEEKECVASPATKTETEAEAEEALAHSAHTVKAEEGNSADPFKVMDGGVIRTQHIETLMYKMQQCESDSEPLRAPRQLNNPTTHAFSTYYQRDEQNVGGVLVGTDAIARAYVESCTLREPKHETEADAADDAWRGHGSSSEMATESTAASNVRRRAQLRREQQNVKRARKYVPPSQELSRLQIREDIRRMRSPSKHRNDKGYVHGDAEEDEGRDTHRKEKRRRRDDSASPAPTAPSAPSAQSLLTLSALSGDPKPVTGERGNELSMEPQRKRQRVNGVGVGVAVSAEPIKCTQCNKIFTLEVDLLLHKTNVAHCGQ